MRSPFVVNSSNCVSAGALSLLAEDGLAKINTTIANVCIITHKKTRSNQKLDETRPAAKSAAETKYRHTFIDNNTAETVFFPR